MGGPVAVRPSEMTISELSEALRCGQPRTTGSTDRHAVGHSVCERLP